jgi:hypothetical protein
MQRIGDFAVLQRLYVDPYATLDWQLADDLFCGIDTQMSARQHGRRTLLPRMMT